MVRETYTTAIITDIGTDPLGKTPCPSAVLSELCSCTWYYEPYFLIRADKITHGENPEQCRIFTDEEQQDSDTCDRGHILIKCQWGAEVIRRVHGNMEWTRRSIRC